MAGRGVTIGDFFKSIQYDAKNICHYEASKRDYLSSCLAKDNRNLVVMAYSQTMGVI